MTSEVSESVIRSRSNNLRSSVDQDDYSDEETRSPNHNSSANANSARPSGSGPQIQSTVKVEGRKENTVDRFKVIHALL